VSGAEIRTAPAWLVALSRPSRADLEGLPMPSKRFNELQDEFFETSKRLRLAQTPQEKLELLTKLQRIVKESKRALAETDPKKSK